MTGILFPGLILVIHLNLSATINQRNRAMMKMKKLDVRKLQEAHDGEKIKSYL
jgi:hypothetical protein